MKFQKQQPLAGVLAKFVFLKISSEILGILVSIGELGVEAQKDIILIFQELFSLINMYGSLG